MSIEAKALPPYQARLYAALDGKGEVSIDKLYVAVIPGGTAEALRLRQQCLGPFITRLNRRLKQQRKAVRPGRLKGTYALVRE